MYRKCSRKSFFQRGTAGLLAVLAAALLASPLRGAARADEDERPIVRAPELEGAEAWINVDRPVRLADLKGKIVLLDFWTYGCINCHHVFPDLERLEKKYGERLAVIGIHSAKFSTEKVTENIRQAAGRYGLKHPIANDAEFRIWRAYAIQAWPTLVLIDGEGNLVGGVSGEGHYDLLDRVIGELLEKAGMKVEAPAADAAVLAAPGSNLLYPGKIAAGGDPIRLYVSDTRHHRLVAFDLDGRVQAVYGSGAPGLRDGRAAEARFHAPQGLCADGAVLYVADTENHVIRIVDLKKGEVRTAAGTGKQARWPASGGKATDTRLNSPWDVLADGGSLYIAMAGTHQIWRMDIRTGIVGPWIGSGREAITDGPAGEATLAQPSGLALAGGTLYIADSESSGVRAFDIAAERLRTLIGAGLFEFGDGEGKGGKVLQHPLAVVKHGGDLIIADTYNHRLKRLDLEKGEVRFWLGTGMPGAADGKSPGFWEPGGLAIHAGKLYVADTNNHRIRVVDLATGDTSTLVLKDAAPK